MFCPFFEYISICWTPVSTRTVFPRNFEDSSPFIQPLHSGNFSTIEFADQPFSETHSSRSRQFAVIVHIFFSFSPSLLRFRGNDFKVEGQFFFSRSRWMAIAFSSSTSSHQVLKLKISADLKFGFAFKLKRKGSFVSRFAEDTLPTF